MSAFRTAAGFLVFAVLAMLVPLLAYAEEAKCDAASKTGGGTVTNDCKVCVTTITGEKKWVGASCTVTGGGDKTSANCTANHGVAPGTCATKYCVGTKCFNAQVNRKPALEDALGLKNETALNNLQSLLSNPKSGASGVTPVKDDPTAGQLDRAFEQSPSLEKISTEAGSGLNPQDINAKLNELGMGLNPETKAAELQSALDKAAELQAQGKNASVQVESTLSPEQRAQLLAEHGIDPSKLDPQDPLRQYAEAGKNTFTPRSYDPYDLGSCSDFFCSAIKTAQEGFQKLFSGDQHGGKTSDHKVSLYYPGGCTVGPDPGCSPGIEGGKVGSKSNYIDRNTPVVAAGENSGYKFGDVLKITNPKTGEYTYAVVGDKCPACGSGIDLTPRVFNELGTYSQVNGRDMSVEVVSRGNSWSGGLTQVASLNSGSQSIAWNGSIATIPSNVVVATAGWEGGSMPSPVRVASLEGGSAPPSGAPSRTTVLNTSANTVYDTNFRPVETPPILQGRRNNVAQSGGQSSGNNISQYPSLYPQPTPPILQGRVPNTGVTAYPQPTPPILQGRVPNTGVPAGSDAASLVPGRPGGPSGAAVTQAPGQRWQDGVNRAMESAGKVLNDAITGAKNLGSAAYEKLASIVSGEPTGQETTGKSVAQSTGGSTDNYKAPGGGAITEASQRAPETRVQGGLSKANTSPPSGGAITEASQGAPARQGSAAILDAGQRRASPSKNLDVIDGQVYERHSPPPPLGDTTGQSPGRSRDTVLGSSKNIGAPEGGAITQKSQGAPPARSVSLEQIGSPSPGQGSKSGDSEPGDKGSEVLNTQRALNAILDKPIAEPGQPGSPGHETDVFGPKTLAGVKAFQKANGLTPDGIVGPQTRAALNKAIEARNSAVPPPETTAGGKSGRPQVNTAPGGDSKLNTPAPSGGAITTAMQEATRDKSSAPPASVSPSSQASPSVVDPAHPPESLPQESIPPTPVRKPASASQPQAQQQTPAVAGQAAAAAEKVSTAATTAKAEGKAAEQALDPVAGKAALDKLYTTARSEANMVISTASGTYKSDVSSRLTALRNAVARAKRGIDGVVSNWGSPSSRATLQARVARVRSATNNLITTLRNSPK